MKPWHKWSAAILFVCAAGIAIAVLCHSYFKYISQRIYEDSTSHLVEVYSQVNHNFAAFLEKNWGNLRDWERHLRLENEEGILAYLQEQQGYWGFSQFYFLGKDGSYVTPAGDRGQFLLEHAQDSLFQEGGRIMSNETLPSGQAVTVFAVSVPEGSWRGFGYSAIALSYTNADVVASLDVNAFSNQSACFIIDVGGRVLLSTQQGGSIFGNYIAYLRAGSDLDEAALAQLQQAWEAGQSGIISCTIGGVGYYISYQGVGYQDCILLGIVPEAAAGAILQQIQRATFYVLAIIFALVAITPLLVLLYSYWQNKKKSALELRYREMIFNTLSINVDDVFMMLDCATFHLDFLSSNVERLLGLPHENVLENVRLLEAGATEDCGFISKEAFAAIPIHGSAQWEREHVHQVTGERLWYRETVYHENVDGMEKFLVVMSDRTQEKEMNRHLQEALDAAKSANEAKSHFLSNMSHDIRTPMNAIIGFSVFLARDAENPEKVREYTRKITSSGQHLLSLINDVLDMSKIESGKTSLKIVPFSLPGLIEELHNILLPQANAKNQAFEIHTEGQLAEELTGDKLHLNQILINLLSNAVKYTPEGGQIDFLVKELPATSPHYARIRFAVKDNGIGMSEAFLETVFEPFAREITAATSQIQGTGLGMAITRNLVELMGGTIEVESKLGQGSIFTVELSFALAAPREEKTIPDPQKPPVTEGHTLEGMMFLVAEDNEINAEILSEMLAMEGARCELAVNGQEALEMFAASEAGRYDMILMDVQMPVMNGYEATRAIRACSHPRAMSIPIVAMTANAFAEDVHEALKSGMNDHLAKPIDMEAMKALLGSLRQANPTDKENPNGTKQAQNPQQPVLSDKEGNPDRAGMSQNLQQPHLPDKDGNLDGADMTQDLPQPEYSLNERNGDSQ